MSKPGTVRKVHQATGPGHYGRVVQRPTPALPLDPAQSSWIARRDLPCRDEDPELFFPVGSIGISGSAQAQVAQAKAVCRRCPVVEECLQWALETGQDYGVWGGLSEDELREIKRRGVRR